MKKYIVSIAALSLLIPVVSFAAFEGIKTMVQDVGFIVGQFYGLVIVLAMLFFFWGLAQFILKSGDPKAKEEGRNRMIWGVIALFVIFSIYGLIRFIQANLDIRDNAPIEIPIVSN